MKSLIVAAVLFCVADNCLAIDSSNFTPAQLKTLETISLDKLSKHVQTVVLANDKIPITDIGKPTGPGGSVITETDNGDRWCCEIGLPISTMTKSRVRYRTVRENEKYHTKCGFLGLGRCTRYRVVYRQVSYTEIYAVPQKQSCPVNHLVCCRSFLRIANYCLAHGKVPEIMSDLIQLQQQGLLGV